MDLSTFGTVSLFDATTHLFEQLGIKLNSATATPIPLAQLLGSSYRDREPFNMIREAYFIGTVDDAVFLNQTDLFANQNNTLDAIQQRADRDDTYNGLLVFALDLGQTIPTRTELAELARAFNRVSRKLPVAVVFRYESRLGLSEPGQHLISLAAVERTRYAKGQEWRPGEKLGKVSILKDIDINRPHTGHLRILQGLDIRGRTGKQAGRGPAITNFREFYRLWQETFSVSVLNRLFYRELFHWYLWAVQTVKFPKPADETLSDEAHASISVIRLLTRLIFVWFVKEKGLIPGKLFDPAELADLLKGADGGPFDASHAEDGSYYQAILQNLFFATLNTPMDADAKSETEKRQFVDKAKKGAKGYSDDYGDQTRYRYAELFRPGHDGHPADALTLFAPVPFLNGGLFECLDRTANKDTGETERRYDGFTSTKAKRAMVPNALFFGQTELDLAGEYNETKAKPIEIRGLIHILNRYKFTIAENTPLDEEVALDPELLGRVFENLLASYNPETKSTARKQTGSFYTPREIVGYMVDESLKAYLLQKLTAPVTVAQTEFGKKQTSMFGNEVKRGQASLIELVATVPFMPEAEARQKLDLLFNDAHRPGELDANPFASHPTACQILIDAIGAANILDPACGSGAFPMGILHRMVTLLARLDPNNRSWREVQKQKAIAETQNAFDEGDSKIREDRLRQISEAFEHNSSDYGRKLFLIENCIYGVDIQQIAVQIAKLRFFISLIVEQRVDDSRPNRNILSMPNLETKFVAANTLVALERPTSQLNVFGEGEVRAIERKLNERRKQIFFVRRYSEKKKLQKEEAKLRQELQQVLIKNLYPKGTASQMAGWNPFDAMHSAEFFDAETMFGDDLKDGFDVVIGNPPYVQLAKLRDAKERDIFSRYQTYERTGDLYCLFYEQAVNLLRLGGILSFITSNSWLQTQYGRSLRTFFTANTNPLILINFADAQLFQAAIVETNILMAQRGPCQYQLQAVNIGNDYTLDTALNHYVAQHAATLTVLPVEGWSIGNTDTNILKTKFETVGKKIVNWEVAIYRGVTTGYNKAFVIDKATEVELISQNEHNAEVMKPTLRGRDLRRYSYTFCNEWLLFIPWHFPLHNDSTIQGASNKAEVAFEKQYPSLYRYFLNYKENLNQRNQAETGIRYEWYALQRCAASYWQFFNEPKIIWGELSNQAKFTYDDAGHYVEATLFMMTGESLKYLLGILNSQAAQWYFEQITTTSGMGTNRWKKYKIEQLPVPVPTRKQQTQIETLVNRILTGKKAYEDTTSLERQIDVLVYRLYGLSHDEVLIVEPGFGMARGAYEG